MEVITGTMFAGKTTEMLARLDVERKEGRGVLLITRDTRFGEGQIGTHDGERLEVGTFAKNSQEVDHVITQHPEAYAIGIDEAQFYDESLVDVCGKWALQGKRVVVSGLSQDFRGEPFLTTALLMAEADQVIRITSECASCGQNSAVRNHRKVDVGGRIMEGASDLYEPLCRQCFGTK